MKRKLLIAFVVLICLSAVAFIIFAASMGASLIEAILDDDLIIETIDIDISDSDDAVTEMITREETEYGGIYLSITKKGMAVVSYLEKDRTSETNYISFGSVVGKADDIISDDPTHIMKIDIADYDDDIYFGICSDERAQELTVNGIPIETEFVHMEIGDTDYSGYFWFWKSADKPVVRVCEK